MASVIYWYYYLNQEFTVTPQTSLNDPTMCLQQTVIISFLSVDNFMYFCFIFRVPTIQNWRRQIYLKWQSNISRTFRDNTCQVTMVPSVSTCHCCYGNDVSNCLVSLLIEPAWSIILKSLFQISPLRFFYPFFRFLFSCLFLFLVL